MQVVKTDCALCYNSCGINVYVEGGRVVKVEGMPEHPLNRGVLCPRGEALIDYVYSPDRLKYPMKREGDTWRRISWDEALTVIASRLKEVREKYGAHAFAIYAGSVGVENIEMNAFAHRFKGAYGTPNFFSVESLCFRARILARQLTFGKYLVEDLENANCIVLWGHNPESSNHPWAKLIHERVDAGARLIVINPMRIPLSSRGIHVYIKPGTDLALALSMMNVVISEGLYDKDFVDKYAVGFDSLKEHVKQYAPEKVEELTWVPAPEIRKIARVYATTKPACVVQGINALDQTVHGVQNSRAISILQTITGNVDTPGGFVTCPFPRLTDLRIPVAEKPIGAEEHPVFYSFWGRVMPYGQAMLMLDAILKGRPYPIKAMVVMGANPAVTFPDASAVRKASEELEFLVVMDVFMTETAELADIVLPACTFLEKMGVAYDYAVTHGIPYLMLRKRVIEPLYESRAEWWFWSELGRRMGYGELFPWRTEEEVVTYLLRDSGVTLRQLIENPEGVFFGSKQYKPGDYRTPSGKIEIYSKTLEEHGYDPLPAFREELLEKTSPEYPLLLVTGARDIYFTHSQMRNIARLRSKSPEPFAIIHPDTASAYSIVDGGWVRVETRKGGVKIRAKLSSDVMPLVVSVPHGWAQANVNALTGTEIRDPISGYPVLKGIPCRVSRA
ncbi:MAG: molybdopterin-dependent oxidoreductase [Candidatus Nezhaarchaeota archaeon]|nr:molybdopterin-dependent oxidoreductase [Candidatus Nezhaarchaeota archaeon]